MLPISYPKDIKQFKDDYLKLFNITTIQKEYDDLVNGLNHESLISVNFNDLLVAEFNVLVEFAKLFSSYVWPDEKEVKYNEFIKLINYERYQSKIAQFFVKYSKELNLSTCYFCNIDFINAFTDLSDYKDGNDLINNGLQVELTKISGIGPATAKKIVNYKKFVAPLPLLVKDLEKIKINEKQLSAIKKLDISSSANHFTLDHLINKADHPLLSLSLFNFVPSCYSCNAKFKKDKDLIDINEIDCGKISPTSSDFTFHKENKFKLFFKPSNNGFLNIKQVEDFKLQLTNRLNNDSHSQRYIDIFKLNARYKAHKNDVLELISKSNRYSPKKIEQIASLLDIDSIDVYDDIMGGILTKGELNQTPKAKLSRDIAENIGLLKVRGKLSK